MKRWLASLLLLVVVWSAHDAHAQGDALTEMKTYFNAGAEAYEVGDFSAAIQAFEQAYASMPRPAILFSLAQAERRHYVVSRDPARLVSAIEHLRAYLAVVQEGGRRKDAADILTELEAIAAREAPRAAQETPAPTLATRLMVTSPTKDARVIVDATPPRQPPVILEIEPGPHVVRLIAQGFFDESRDVLVAQGNLTAIDLVLREKPGVIVLEGVSGATVFVDSQNLGTAPIAPISLPSGRHVIGLSKNGFDGWTTEVELGPGQTKVLSPPLRRSVQRKVATALVPIAGVAILAGALLTYEAASAEQTTTDLLNAANARPLTVAQRDAYNDALARRNDLRLGAYVTYGAGALLAGTALVLVIFDTPAPPSTGADSRPARAPALTVSPVAGLGVFGATLYGRF